MEGMRGTGIDGMDGMAGDGTVGILGTPGTGTRGTAGDGAVGGGPSDGTGGTGTFTLPLHGMDGGRSGDGALASTITYGFLLYDALQKSCGPPANEVRRARSHGACTLPHAEGVADPP